ncbi:hypothetical protein V6R21_20430 [Limibacter armeniacum]|uniref:hypothetical protein n=1 Tax=Limibacter armeniacum TaxID=466084 RepID=UPI002FE54FBA
MFELPKNKSFLKGLISFKNERTVLFSDGENDLIYTGFNNFGNRVLSVISFEDDDEEYIRYFYMIVTDDQYHQFLQGRLSVLSIMRSNESFFVVDLNYGEEIIRHAVVSLDNIPFDFHPLEDSYCPEFIREPSLSYSASLNGTELSDSHKATPEALNMVNTQFANMLREPMQILKDFNLQGKVYVEPPMTGSFKLNFRVDLNNSPQITIHPISTESIELFLNKLYTYILHDFQNEDDLQLSTGRISTASYESLKEDLQTLYLSQHIKYEEDDLNNILTGVIDRSLDSLVEIEFDEGYTVIDFINYSKEGNESEIAHIEEESILAIKNKLSKLKAPVEEDVDEFLNLYRIQVYKFNTKTGIGNAIAIIDGQIIKNVKLIVKGLDSYTNTQFTESLHSDSTIDIRGIGKRVNGKLKEIVVNN